VKGSIAQCAEELVRTRFGDATWDEVCAQAGLRRDTSFMPAADIEDGDVMRVLGAIGTVCRLDAEQVADAFGEYWVCEYASRQYPAYFRGAGNARELILKMNNVHDMVTRSVARARPPRFGFSWDDEDTLVIDYQSSRNLAGLLVGLVKGVGIHFHETLGVSATGNRVTVRFAPVAAAV
jgi:hypothetical protein